MTGSGSNAGGGSDGVMTQDQAMAASPSFAGQSPDASIAAQPASFPLSNTQKALNGFGDLMENYKGPNLNQASSKVSSGSAVSAPFSFQAMQNYYLPKVQNSTPRGVSVV